MLISWRVVSIIPSNAQRVLKQLCPWDNLQMMRPLRFNVIPLKMKHFNLEISSLGVSNLDAFTSQSVIILAPTKNYL